jgi:tetratricopeptide (TPR) repeat protein
MRSGQTRSPGLLLGLLLLLLCCGDDAGLQHTSTTQAYGRALSLDRAPASREAAAVWVALKRRPDLRGGSGDDCAGKSSAPEPADAYDESEVLRRADRLRKEENRPAEALELYREVIWRGNSRNVDALGGAAAVLIARQSTLGEARDLLEKALEVAPTDARVLHGLGMTEWAASRNATAAASYFARAMRLDPSYARSRCAMANMLEEQGEAQQADEMMREALAALPSQSEILNDYGALVAGRANANLSQAEALFRRAVHLAPTSAAPVYNHAQIHMQRADLDGAEPLLRQVFSPSKSAVAGADGR